MPWLYYQTSADKVINDTQKIKFDVSFDSNDNVNVNQLQFFIAKYDIFGKYLGMTLLTNELELCSNTYEDGYEYRSFGTTIINRCNINLSKFLDRNFTMYFYELYLLDPTTNLLIDVPIMIDNIPNPKASGVTGNMNNSTAPIDWILVRRFFLIDNLSGIQGANAFDSGTVTPFAIRFPRLLKLIITLQNGPGAKIMVPFLEIFYKAKTANYIKQEAQSLVMFVSEYRMDIESFKSAMNGIFIALNVLVGIFVCIRMYIWYKLNPPTLSPDNYNLWFLWVGLFKLFQYWGLTMFWFIWGISAYWFIFFKLQYRVFLLLPPLGTWYDNYRPFDIIFGIACSAYTFYICHKVADQVNMDIFFIDWEHDKEILVKNANELRTEKYRGAWRVLQVANQFNELQKKRIISLSFCFFWLVFMWGYLRWDLNVNAIPSTKVALKSPDNYILQHFLSSWILIMAGIGHIFFSRFFQLWIPLKKQEFMDLLCVSNISVFILDQSLHGYYLHGQSPSGKADTNLDELLRFLEEEGTGRVRGRGLIEKDHEDLQCYEIFISYKMRTMYDGMYGLQSETMILSAQNRDKLANQSRIINILRHLPKSLQIDKIYKLKTYMNAELKEKIQKVSSQPLRYVREKTNLQRFLDYPPLEVVGNTDDEIVFYKDPNMNFDEVLILGIEWDWFIWDLFIFQMFQLTINNTYISIYLTFICDEIMFKARTFFGEKNLAKKAIIDNKFFN
jgi:meckelin